ncbi:hypothetical protein GUITHDRAFT_121856 [Guillardia theta CCMP2712]|uniref:Uncharacterized protein n=1 Tax=Guillardia theta (strain CCMP2712) TaxID=905079 RepID=L1I6U4_GUITC|nr:hypothetical protein GUITHDRAFT_121856 [Guillardia theta CCMP2712]EKX31983.1 hypothetical protein GUITHDRAFT_121856 [Guillardia theta CCMP2712]|eukprot:XP_005818963.1 hypothetical protein GUITHDRAFT_121856 [Guillardia theta CCMP2712]
MAGRCRVCGRRSEEEVCEACAELDCSSPLLVFSCSQCGSENQIVESDQLLCEVCGHCDEHVKGAETRRGVKDEQLSIGASDSGTIDSFFCSTCSAFNQNVLISQQGACCEVCGSREANPRSTLRVARKLIQPPVSSLGDIPEEPQVLDRFFPKQPKHDNEPKSTLSKLRLEQTMPAAIAFDTTNTVSSSISDLLQENAQLKQNIIELQNSLSFSEEKLKSIGIDLHHVKLSLDRVEKENSNYTSFHANIAKLLLIPSNEPKDIIHVKIIEKLNQLLTDQKMMQTNKRNMNDNDINISKNKSEQQSKQNNAQELREAEKEREELRARAAEAASGSEAEVSGLRARLAEAEGERERALEAQRKEEARAAKAERDLEGERKAGAEAYEAYEALAQELREAEKEREELRARAAEAASGSEAEVSGLRARLAEAEGERERALEAQRKEEARAAKAERDLEGERKAGAEAYEAYEALAQELREAEKEREELRARAAEAASGSEAEVSGLRARLAEAEGERERALEAQRKEEARAAKAERDLEGERKAGAEAYEAYEALAQELREAEKEREELRARAAEAASGLRGGGRKEEARAAKAERDLEGERKAGAEAYEAYEALAQELREAEKEREELRARAAEAASGSEAEVSGLRARLAEAEGERERALEAQRKEEARAAKAERDLEGERKAGAEAYEAYEALAQELREAEKEREELRARAAEAASGSEAEVSGLRARLAEAEGERERALEAQRKEEARAAKAERDLEGERKAGAEAYEICSDFDDLQNNVGSFESEVVYLRSRLRQIERLLDGLPCDYVSLVEDTECLREDLQRRKDVFVKEFQEFTREKESWEIEKAELMTSYLSIQRCPSHCVIVSREVLDQVDMLTDQVSEITSDIYSFKHKCIARLSAISRTSKDSYNYQAGMIQEIPNVVEELNASSFSVVLSDAHSKLTTAFSGSTQTEGIDPSTLSPGTQPVTNKLRLAASSPCQRSAAEEFEATLSSMREGSPTSLKFVEEALREYPRVVLDASHDEKLVKEEVTAGPPPSAFKAWSLFLLAFLACLAVGCLFTPWPHQLSSFSSCLVQLTPSSAPAPPSPSQDRVEPRACDRLVGKAEQNLAECLEREHKSRVMLKQLQVNSTQLHEALHSCRTEQAMVKAADVCQDSRHLLSIAAADAKEIKNEQVKQVRNKLTRQLAIWSRFM